MNLCFDGFLLYYLENVNQRNELLMKMEMNIKTDSNNFKITYQQWETLYSRLKENRNIEQLYDYLIAKGDRYAIYAKRFLNRNAIIGSFTVNYLASSAKENGLGLIFRNYESIYYDLAEQYLLWLEKQFTVAGKETIEVQVNHQAAIQFHENSFNRHRLPTDAWLFSNVFSVLPEERRESFWQKSLNVMGDVEKETSLSIELIATMVGVAETGTTEEKMSAQYFFQRIIDIKTEMDSGSIGAQRLQPLFSHPKMENLLIKIKGVISMDRNSSESNSVLKNLSFDSCSSTLEFDITEFEKISIKEGNIETKSEIDSQLAEQMSIFDIGTSVVNQQLLPYEELSFAKSNVSFLHTK